MDNIIYKINTISQIVISTLFVISLFIIPVLVNASPADPYGGYIYDLVEPITPVDSDNPAHTYNNYTFGYEPISTSIPDYNPSIFYYPSTPAPVERVTEQRPTCTGCGNIAGNDDCVGCGTTPTPVYRAQPYTPTRTVSQPSRSGTGIINDLLDLNLGYTSVKYDNDTTTNIDDHSYWNYQVTNTDNSNRSVRNTYSYSDNSSIDSSVRITSDDDYNLTYSYIAYNDDDDHDNNNDDLRVVCRVSDTRVEEGDSVRFEADVDGGDYPYEYDWRGDIDGDDRVETYRFNRDGRYEVSIRVEDDDGNVDTDDCPIVVVDDDDDNNNNNNVNLITSSVNNPPSGNLASLNSVFLSQVPYTGAKDTLMIIAYTLAILSWSAVIVFTIAKRKTKNRISNKIKDFKYRNKSAQIIGY